MPELSIQFYRSKQNAKKLNRLATLFCFHEIPQELDEYCQVALNEHCGIEDFKRFDRLWDRVRAYKDSMMFADGRLLTKEQTEDVLNWVRCYCNHQYFPDQQDYCFEIPGSKDRHGWGCKWLHSILRHGTYGRHRGIRWYKVGPFQDGIQFIDKQDIKDKLTAEAAAKCLFLCPLFSLHKALQHVEQLPGQIDPRADENWEYDLSRVPGNEGEMIGVIPASIAEARRMIDGE